MKNPMVRRQTGKDTVRATRATSPNTALTSKSTNRQLNALINWINTYCRTRDRTDGIPLVDGRPFRATTRQFRRTLAWFITRQPGGAIAGAIHYRHPSIQMFEGYAGTSDSGFRAEVESEQALARGQHYLTSIDTYDHHDLLGLAANEARRGLENFGASASFPGSVVTDRRRLLRIVQPHDPAIYPAAASPACSTRTSPCASPAATHQLRIGHR